MYEVTLLLHPLNNASQTVRLCGKVSQELDLEILSVEFGEDRIGIEALVSDFPALLTVRESLPKVTEMHEKLPITPITKNIIHVILSPF